MNDPETTSEVPLPQLAAVFRGIKSGYHWCFGDPVYAELNSGRFEAYRSFFRQLNLTLHHDPRGFYYATSDDDDFKGNDTITKYVVFTAVWIDSIADQGHDVGKFLFGRAHRIADLPHFSSDVNRRYCTNAGIADQADLQTLLRAMDRLGLLELDNRASFTLRESFNRLLDVCLSPPPETADGASPGGAQP